jgi:hypothetical protein
MTLALDEIATISRVVALEHGRALQVTAVDISDGGSERVEILVTLEDCHRGQRRFLVNVSRADREQFKGELRSTLRDALTKHDIAHPGQS